MFVYFIQAGDDGPVKIGIAADPQKRLDEMQIGNHADLVLIAYRPGGLQMERELHARLASGRIRGEWFAADTPGLKEEISLAIDIETGLAMGRGYLCVQCGVVPVMPPRTKTCSDECATARRLSTSRDWKARR